MSAPAPTIALDGLTAWLAPVSRLAGDRRTAALLAGTVAGILGSGSLVCRQIAAFSPSAGHVSPCRSTDSADAGR